MLKGKKILLGISASIAAYKSVHLASLLRKAGAEVQIIATPASFEFVTPLTLATISHRPVFYEFSDKKTGRWNNHVKFALWADAMLIVPATANTMAKMVQGLCDNLLMATYLSARSPVFLAPAMDLDMYLHPSTQKNIETLKEFGHIIFEPTEGELASGLVGKGRMEEPEVIVKKLHDFFLQKASLKGKKILLTAGPTYEKIDPVRFISNFSSGKMGFAIAGELANAGAEVKLIAGPTSLKTNHAHIERFDVISAQEMYEKSVSVFPQCDGAVLVAAVADFTVLHPDRQKIKSSHKKSLEIKLSPTKDIAAALGKMKKKQLLAGFALETFDEETNARKKIEEKNLDFIVLNSLNDEGAGFQHNTNKIKIIRKDGTSKNFLLKSKTEVAKDVVEEVVGYFEEKP